MGPENSERVCTQFETIVLTLNGSRNLRGQKRMAQTPKKCATPLGDESRYLAALVLLQGHPVHEMSASGTREGHHDEVHYTHSYPTTLVNLLRH